MVSSALVQLHAWPIVFEPYLVHPAHARKLAGKYQMVSGCAANGQCIWKRVGAGEEVPAMPFLCCPLELESARHGSTVEMLVIGMLVV